MASQAINPIDILKQIIQGASNSSSQSSQIYDPTDPANWSKGYSRTLGAGAASEGAPNQQSQPLQSQVSSQKSAQSPQQSGGGINGMDIAQVLLGHASPVLGALFQVMNQSKQDKLNAQRAQYAQGLQTNKELWDTARQTLERQQTAKIDENKRAQEAILGGKWGPARKELVPGSPSTTPLSIDHSEMQLPVTDFNRSPSTAYPSDTQKIGDYFLRQLIAPQTKSNLVTIGANSVLGKHYAELTGDEPDKNGHFAIPSTVFDKISDSYDKSGKAQTNVQALELARQTGLLNISGALKNSADPIDQNMLKMFNERYQTATTSAQSEGITRDAQEYISQRSKAAKAAILGDRLTEVGAAARANAQATRLDKEAWVRSHSMGVYNLMMKSGQDPTQALKGMNPDDRMIVYKDWDEKGLKLPEYLSPKGQETLAEINTTKQMISNVYNYTQTHDVNGLPLIGKDGKPNPLAGTPMSEDNTPFSKLADSLQYKMGKDSELSSFLNQVNVLSEVAKGRIAKGAGIHTQEFVDALRPHVPDPRSDSPKLMGTKIKDINGYLTIQDQNTHRFYNKWGRLAAAGDISDPPTELNMWSGKSETSEDGLVEKYKKK
jgi:hypothetical protein